MSQRFYQHGHVPIHWLPEFKPDYNLLLRAWQRNYRIDRWNTPESLSFKYAVYKTESPGGKEKCGVFDSPEEVTGFLRFLLATAEKEN